MPFSATIKAIMLVGIALVLSAACSRSAETFFECTVSGREQAQAKEFYKAKNVTDAAEDCQQKNAGANCTCVDPASRSLTAPL